MGLVLGTAFAALFAVLAKEDPAPVAAPVVAAPVVVDAAAPVPSPAFAPVDAPWPPNTTRATGQSTHGASRSASGQVSMSTLALEDFYEVALASCSPTTIMAGKAVSLFCETASDESRALIVEGTSAATSWLQTSRTKFELPHPTRSLVDSSLGGSCGWTMRFVALPVGARVSGSGGSTESGHCTFDVDGLPALTWSTMLHNLFRPGTAVHKRQLDDGELTRWTAEGWDGGWWRVDVVSASALAQAPVDEQLARVELTRWAPGERTWVPPIRLDEKIAALERCWEPCSLALRSPARELGPDVRAQMTAGDVIDRCLYECRGTEQAPAVLEPAARAFPEQRARAKSLLVHDVIDLAADDAIP